MYDAAVIGGGILGCATALHLARGGMKVVIAERDSLCRQASGVNAGTHSMQMKRAALIPYALKGWEMWRDAPQWLGMEVGFRTTGGLTLAFTEDEAEALKTRMGRRIDAGAPIEMVTAERARAIEPGLSDTAVLASYCPIDGFANAALTGLAMRRALLEDGVDVRERSAVDGIERDGGGFVVRAGETRLAARRVVLAAGVWAGPMLAWLGVPIDIVCGARHVAVTERTRPIMRTILGEATGKLSIIQPGNGTVLIGGGWPAVGSPKHGSMTVIPKNLVGNFQLACATVPALTRTRVVRAWPGLDANVADHLPLVGALPGLDDAFIIGCVRGGYTTGPYMGRLLGELILGREPEMALFDPGRFGQASHAVH
ncbi:MAG: FAD-dependent oxidoreductase [Rhodospirillales bacterium]|jgi:glycine/D-amino acid oxidase-like deaminating enzyme|nr:FAD-dependent oxidoreductase [Rhodospirillales bacterium]MDP6883429.1 FAD-dependent oxidoreductase [Rhodospirillales bacterium]